MIDFNRTLAVLLVRRLFRGSSFLLFSVVFAIVVLGFA